MFNTTKKFKHQLKVCWATTLIIMALHYPLYHFGAFELSTYLFLGWAGAGGSIIGCLGVRPDRSMKELAIVLSITVIPPAIYILSNLPILE